MKHLLLVVAAALALSGCTATGGISALGTEVTQAAGAPLAVCTAVVSQAAMSLGALKAQLNVTVLPTP
jgi:surface antigen